MKEFPIDYREFSLMYLFLNHNKITSDLNEALLCSKDKVAHGSLQVFSAGYVAAISWRIVVKISKFQITLLMTFIVC